MIYLSTGEVAKLLHISKRTLQNWLKLQKINIPQKANNGYYLWSTADVQLAQQYKVYIESTTNYIIGTGNAKNGL
jgi:DNA-binding transcriptional MerR regulator